MNISELQARATRLERELREVRDLLAQAAHDAEAVTAELVRTRAYAFSAALPLEDVVASCVDSLDRYGFCVIDNVIPDSQVDDIRDEVLAARDTVTQKIKGISGLVEREGLSAEELLKNPAAKEMGLRPVRRVGHPPKIANDIVWMPKYAQHLANPIVTAVARRVLDDHLRIAQMHPRIIKPTKPNGTPGDFGTGDHRGCPEIRGWHTDWPHDLSAYGMGDPQENVGCIRQPFPDVTMCLVMIWYFSDVDENSGGTWAVPGSHKDKRNPRGPSDGISVAAPIPGDMQIRAKAGSVYIQDSRI